MTSTSRRSEGEANPSPPAGMATDVALLAALVAVTLLSFWAGHEQVAGARAWWTVAILVIAFAKAIAIGLLYMGLAHAPRVLRYAFLAWATVCCAAVTLVVVL